MKAPKKLMSIVMSGAMLIGAAAPFAAPVAPAMAADYTALQVPNVDDDSWTKLGSAIIEVEPAALHDGDSVIVSLPGDFKFANWDKYDFDDVNIVDDNNVTIGNAVYTIVSAPATYQGNTNAFYDASSDENSAFSVEVLDENQLKITVNTDNMDSAAEGAYLKIDLPSVYVDKGFEGDIYLNFDADSGSGFTSGDVVVGRVGTGDVTVTVVDDDTFSDDATVKLRIKESRAGALEDDTDETLKFVLPDGFVWKDSNEDISVGKGLKKIWGDDNLINNLKFTVDKDELSVELPKGKASSEATCFEVTLAFEVDDETDADYGDVKVDVKGDTSVTTPEIVVGEYGDYSSSIEAEDSSIVAYAGEDEQDISDITIKESLQGSLVDGRTILLTLPSNARWQQVDGKDIDTLSEDEVVESDAGVDLLYKGLTGDNDRTLKLEVDSNDSSDKAELTLEDLQVKLEAGKTGDLIVEVGGSAGLSGQVKVASVVAPVTITAAGKSDVKLGLSAQAVPDLTITEAKAGAISEDGGGKLLVDLPDGFKFTQLPKVEVTAGDLDIDESNVTRTDNDNTLEIPIDNDSNEASTITISGIQYTVDRTVPEGDVKVKVKGDAVVETDDIWPNSTSAAEVVNATVVTPAPGETKQSAKFTIGSTSYTVNGVEATMDVAAYTENGRTYLPVRFVANALGIAPENILWDGKTATFIGNGRVVQATPGSSVLTINGSPVQMDVVAVEKDGRVMVPFRWIAQAFGAQVDYDEATQTVTMNL